MTKKSRGTSQGIPLRLTFHERCSSENGAVEGQLAYLRAVRTMDCRTLVQAGAQHHGVPGHSHVVADPGLTAESFVIGEVVTGGPAGSAVETQIGGSQGRSIHARSQLLAKGSKRELSGGIAHKPVRKHTPPLTTLTSLQAVHHRIDGQELQMPMRLAGPGVRPTVEEDKEAAAPRSRVAMVEGTDARVRGGQVVALEEVRLGSEFLGDEQKMLRNDGELVQHEDVRRRQGRDDQPRRRVLEWIWRLGARGLALRCFRLAGEGRGESHLELEGRSACAGVACRTKTYRAGVDGEDGDQAGEVGQIPPGFCSAEPCFDQVRQICGHFDGRHCGLVVVVVVVMRVRRGKVVVPHRRKFAHVYYTRDQMARY